MSLADKVYKEYFIAKSNLEQAELDYSKAKNQLDMLYDSAFKEEAEKLGLISEIFYDSEKPYYKFKDGYHWFYVSHLMDRPSGSIGRRLEPLDKTGLNYLDDRFEPLLLVSDGNSKTDWLTTIVENFVDKMPYDRKSKQKDLLYKDYNNILDFVNNVTKNVQEAINELSR
jgi:hypothetical protein